MIQNYLFFNLFPLQHQRIENNTVTTLNDPFSFCFVLIDSCLFFDFSEYIKSVFYDLGDDTKNTPCPASVPFISVLCACNGLSNYPY